MSHIFLQDVQRPLRREAAPAAAVSVRCVASCGASSRVLPTRRPEVKKRPLHDLSLPATHPTPIDDISTGAPAHIRAGGWIVKTLRHLYILIISVDVQNFSPWFQLIVVGFFLPWELHCFENARTSSAGAAAPAGPNSSSISRSHLQIRMARRGAAVWRDGVKLDSIYLQYSFYLVSFLSLAWQQSCPTRLVKIHFARSRG